MLMRLTNDYYVSTIHRVVNVLGKERYSIPLFFEPNSDSKIICIEKFCS